MPKEKWGEMERCVADVKAKGGTTNPYAVCYDSIMGKKKRIWKDIKIKNFFFSFVFVF